MSLEQIGPKLKAAREAQGLSIGQVYDRTKIQPNHIEAIENGRLEDLPEPVYVAGFIKRYGDFVGLSGQSLADEYKRSSQPQEAKAGLFHRSAAPSPVPVAYVTKARPETQAPSFSKTFFYPALLLFAILGVVAALLYWQQSQLAAQQDPSVLALRDSTLRFNSAQTTTTANTPQLPTTPQTTALQPEGSKVGITASQHVWVEVKARSTGQALFVGYLEKGDRREYQDAQGVTVRAGNGGSLSVEYQGKSEVFGENGKVKERDFIAAAPIVDPNAALTTAAAGTATTGVKPPVTTVKRKISLQRSDADGSAARERRSRRLDDGPTRDIPGLSSGHSGRSIDVPYRYTEGRLDND